MRARSHQGEPADEPRQKKRTCSICAEKFTEFPCSARPINDGECCPRCDDLIVTSIRIVEAQDVKASALITDAIQRAIEMRKGKKQAMAELAKLRKKKAQDESG